MDISELVKPLLILLAENRMNKLVDSLFDAESNKFDKVLMRVSRRLEEQFGHSIFGGNTYQKLTEVNTKYELKKILKPYSNLDTDELAKHIDFSTLPNEFLTNLQEILVEELLNEPSFIGPLASALKTSQIDDVHKISKENNEILKKLSEKQILISGTDVVDKKQYSPVDNYIPRRVTDIKDINKFFNSDRSYLEELIVKRKRIVLLGIAGLGKSIELKNLAFVYSKDESPFYPIIIRLNTYTNEEIETIISNEFQDWFKIPADRLLLIFDGLDEVSLKDLNHFVRKVLAFSQQGKYLNSCIVISCRNNFYTTEKENTAAKLEGFNTYYLQELTHGEAKGYIEKKLNTHSVAFFNGIEQNKIYHLLSNPFYLVFLVKIFELEGKLPLTRSEVYERIIEVKIQEDRSKYENSEIDLSENIVTIKNEIKRIALIAETLGRNYITNEEFQIVSKDHSLRRLIKHSFLFNRRKAEDDLWEFEHNIFQEYLAGKALSDQSLDTIKSYVSIDPNNRKINPTWLNTLSFIYSLIDTPEKLQKLLHWLLETEPDVLIRFEKIRIDLNVREQVFTSIYDFYKQRGILIRNEKFESYELAKFVSDSKDIVEFLISELKNSDSEVIVLQTIQLLPFFKKVYSFKAEIQSIIEEKLLSDDLDPSYKLDCLYTLSDLQIGDKSLVIKLLSKLNLQSSKYLRAGIYRYLLALNQQDNFVEVLLNGMESVNPMKFSWGGARTDKNESITLGDESFNLIKALKAVKKYSSVKAILDWFSKHPEHDYHQGIGEALIEILNESGVRLFQSHQEIFGDVLNLLRSFNRKHIRKYDVQFRSFFQKTKTAFKAFQELYKCRNENFELFLAMVSVMDRKCVDFIINEYSKNRISDQDIFRIRNCLVDNSRELQNYFYEEINRLSNNKFQFPKVRDWDQEKKDRNYNDLDLLLNRESFLQEVRSIYENENQTIFSKEELWDYKKENLRDENLKHDVVIRLLRDLAKNSDLDLSTVETFLNDDSKWEWFVIGTLIDYDSNYVHIELRPKEIEFIKSWCGKYIDKADFISAIKLNPQGTVTYRYLENYIAYFTKRFQIIWSEPIMLDLLFVDWHGIPTRRAEFNENQILNRLGPYIVESVGLEVARIRLVENLKADKLNIPDVLVRHYETCRDYQIKEALPFLYKEFFKNTLSEYDKRRGLEWYFELGGDVNLMEEIIERVQPEVKWDLIDLLLNYGSNKVILYLLKTIRKRSISETEKLKAAEYLMRRDKIQGLKFIHRYIKAYRRFPEIYFPREQLIQSTDEEALDILLGIFSITCGPNFISNNRDNKEHDVLYCIMNIGSKSESGFTKVRTRFQYLINRYATKYLHYQIQKLEQMYYSNKSVTVSVEEALEKVDKILSV